MFDETSDAIRFRSDVESVRECGRRVEKRNTGPAMVSMVTHTVDFPGKRLIRYSFGREAAANICKHIMRAARATPRIRSERATLSLCRDKKETFDRLTAEKGREGERCGGKGCPNRDSCR